MTTQIIARPSPLVNRQRTMRPAFTQDQQDALDAAQVKVYYFDSDRIVSMDRLCATRGPKCAGYGTISLSYDEFGDKPFRVESAVTAMTVPVYVCSTCKGGQHAKPVTEARSVSWEGGGGNGRSHKAHDARPRKAHKMSKRAQIKALVDQWKNNPDNRAAIEIALAALGFRGWNGLYQAVQR